MDNAEMPTLPIMFSSTALQEVQKTSPSEEDLASFQRGLELISEFPESGAIVPFPQYGQSIRMMKAGKCFVLLQIRQ